MRSVIATMASDSVTRKGTKFLVGTLYDGLRRGFQEGMPSLSEHDAHQPLGWAYPRSILLDSVSARLLGSMQVAEPDDTEALLQHYLNHVQVLQDRTVGPHLEAIRQAIGDKLTKDDKGFALGGLGGTPCLMGQDLAKRVAPDVFEQADKDGLLPLAMLNPVWRGVYRYGSLLLFAHPFLRKAQSRFNNVNEELLADLHALRDAKGVSVRVRLDPDCVGLLSAFKMPLELDYWYGPKFNDDLTRITPGDTRHGANDTQRASSGVELMDLFWYSRDGEHTLEAEEVASQPTYADRSGEYRCRYVHSIVDEGTGTIEHLDGAIRAYDEQKYALRKTATGMSKTKRDTVYTKLFRLDGRIPLPDWKSIIHNYFRGNPLIAEYLGTDVGEPEGQAQVPKAEEEVQPTGVAVLLSLEPPKEPPTEPVLRPDTSLRGREPTTWVIPADIVELQKRFKAKSLPFSVPQPNEMLAEEDFYLRFPPIEHATWQSAAGSLGVYVDFIADLVSHSKGYVLAFSLSVTEKESTTTVSFVGHVEDLAEHFRRISSPLPVDGGSLAKWLEVAQADIAKHGKHSPYSADPPLASDATCFKFKREIIEPETFTIDVAEGKMDLLLDESAIGSFGEALREGRVWPVPAVTILGSECSRCGKEYSVCACSRYRDQGCFQIITDMRHCFLFWTDRPARRVWRQLGLA